MCAKKKERNPEKQNAPDDDAKYPCITKRGLLPCFDHIPEIPTQEGPDGIRFDFNAGIRVLLPDNHVAYHCLIIDKDEDLVIHDSVMNEHRFVASCRKYFIRFHLEITRSGESTPVLVHDYDASGKSVIIRMSVPALGDTIAWFSYVERFQKLHQCKVICVMNPEFIPLFEAQYPDIAFTTEQYISAYSDSYATYCIGLFFHDDHHDFAPLDYQTVPLHHYAAMILKTDLSDIPPRVDLSAKRAIREPYVCISAKGSSQAKIWNNPFGWCDVISFLKKSGYRVLCIDKEAIAGDWLVWNYLPQGAEDFTGDIPLQERINIIKDADFFIGLSSGLSWLAWCCHVPVVLISGFTAVFNEFYTPYRIINYHACNGCWNDIRVTYEKAESLWCPRKKNTPEQFECTRLISSHKVICAIKTIPAFIEHEAEFAAGNRCPNCDGGK